MTSSRFREIVIDLATVLAAGSALVVMAVFVHDRFFTTQPSARANDASVKIDDWRHYSLGGHRIGPASARVTIVEFGDYECPACSHFERPLEAILAAHPHDVALVFRHWPLSFHRFAYPAARAAECAAQQNSFLQFHKLLYAKQDSLGLIPFDSLAARSGVKNLRSFRDCAATPGKVAAIEADIAAARQAGATGTPTILLDSLRLGGIPDSAALEKLIGQELGLARDEDMRWP